MSRSFVALSVSASPVPVNQKLFHILLTEAIGTEHFSSCLDFKLCRLLIVCVHILPEIHY